MLCLPVVSTFEEEAKERERETYTRPLNQWTHRSYTGLQILYVEAVKRRKKRRMKEKKLDPPFFHSDLFLRSWREMLPELFCFAKCDSNGMFMYLGISISSTKYNLFRSEVLIRLMGWDRSFLLYIINMHGRFIWALTRVCNASNKRVLNLHTCRLYLCLHRIRHQCNGKTCSFDCSLLYGHFYLLLS